MNIYYLILLKGVAKVLLLIINIKKNDIYEPENIIFILILNRLSAELFDKLLAKPLQMKE
jgi:hypothetical protein